MHGFMSPAETRMEVRPSWRDRVAEARKTYGWFVGVVVLPTLLVAAYFYLVAADQYASEAHYLVRAQSGTQTSASGLGALLGGAGGAASALGGGAEANSVSDYLTSHDVVAALRKNTDLVARFRRPEADFLARLRTDNPTPEALLRYYRSMVDVYFDTETGITELKVRAFRPDDAYAIARSLLQLGEQRVNDMNLRAYQDGVNLSRRQLDEAEGRLRSVQSRVTSYRQAGRDANPTGTAAAQIELVSRLTGELSAARAQLATIGQSIGTNSPQYVAQRQQVASIQAQVAAQSGRLAGEGNTIAAGLGGYEGIQLEREFLAKRYEAASAAFEAARQQAVRQQLYVVRVVDANMPVKSQYPKRPLIILTMFVILLVVYAIGWLIAAGVREHAS